LALGLDAVERGCEAWIGSAFRKRFLFSFAPPASFAVKILG
jgi:hypothetical protein